MVTREAMSVPDAPPRSRRKVTTARRLTTPMTIMAASSIREVTKPSATASFCRRTAANNATAVAGLVVITWLGLGRTGVVALALAMAAGLAGLLGISEAAAIGGVRSLRQLSLKHPGDIRGMHGRASASFTVDSVVAAAVVLHGRAGDAPGRSSAGHQHPARMPTRSIVTRLS